MQTLLGQNRTLPLLAAAACSLLLGSTAPAQQFTDVSSSVGLISESKKTWGDPVWGDFNNDGYLDLIVPCHGLLLSHGPFVYLNNGGVSFSDIRTTCNIGRVNPDSSDWHGFSFGDYDGDGNLDLYVAEGAKGGEKTKSDLLFRGLGDGTFQYTSRLAKIQISANRGRCGYWFDYDNDGKLDLFVKNYAGVNALYKNNGDGTFTETAAAAGLADIVAGRDLGSIVAFADYDNDGFMDLAVTGDGDVEALYRNQGDGTFVEVTTTAGLTPRHNGKGLAWGDYNNDGFPDLYVARGAENGKGDMGDTLYRNNGNGTFTDVTVATGLTETGNTWAPVWGDYDNDGFLDLFVTKAGTGFPGIGNANLLYHNNGNGTFTNVAAAAGVELQDNTSLHRGAAWADYDNDGFLDLIIKDGIGAESDNGTGAFGLHRLFRNNGNSNHFIKVKLSGVQSNRQGIGSSVTVTYAGGMSFRQYDGGGGGNYASQSNQPLHFGIGSATQATVLVKWPSGIINTVPSVAANTTLTVVESATSTPTPTPTPTATPTPTPARPQITEQPRNRTVRVGRPAQFNVAATGDPPLSYQWRKNGTDISGANSDSYITPPTTLDDDGSVFSVVVSNNAGSVTSRDARLAVTEGNPPTGKGPPR